MSRQYSNNPEAVRKRQYRSRTDRAGEQAEATPIPVYRGDGWQNVLTGMGTRTNDRKEWTTFVQDYKLSEIIERNLFAFSGLAQRIINLPVYDGLRKWCTIEGDTDNLWANECRRLSIKMQIRRAWRYARLFGGAVVVMMVKDGKELTEPLDENNIQEIESLRVYGRWRVNRTSWYLDSDDPRYGETEIYVVSPIQQFATSYMVHESRCLIFDGVDVPDQIRAMNNWWGDSVYQAIYQRLRGLGESYGNIEHIIGEFILMVTKIKGLSNKLAMGKEDEITARVMVNQMLRHTMGTYTIDSDGEDAQRVSATTTGLGELMEKMMMAVSAETSIPVRKLFGSPISGAGLSNNGNSENQDYYDFCISEREEKVETPLERLGRIVMLQKSGPWGGKEMDNWRFVWPPLQEEPMSVQLANKKSQSEIDRQYFDMGSLDPDEIRNSRFGSDSYSHETTINSKRAPEKGTEDQGAKTRGD
jgi:phage-related protein (TIGR01555 family)